ncbi:hypothetical protein ACLMJK_004575 [Lecanora helva]
MAIKGGGHTPWEGSSSVHGGITIDLGAMRDVSVNDDQSIVSVGGGSRWIDVYQTLDPLHLAVSGGRVAGVGVTGLILGGGISFFAPRYGWACDQVANFEVVLADGQVVNANVSSNQDLWWALKGGSNNFGIVTTLNLKAFPQGDLWGGMTVNAIDSRNEILEALTTANAISERDEYATVICNFVYQAATTSWMISNNVVYSKAEPYPKALQPFTQIEPSLYDTLRTTNLSDLTLEIDRSNTRGRRYIFITSTYANDADLLHTVFDIANSTLQSIATVPGILYVLSLQSVPSSIADKTSTDAPNALGLDKNVGPQINALLNIHWDDVADDAAVNAAAESWLQRADAEAEKRGLKRRWLYLNYAHKTQDPIGGYGEGNGERLREVSRKYDPEGVFQKVVKGGFKVLP